MRAQTLKVFVLDSALVPHTSEVGIEAAVLSDCAEVHLLHIVSEEEFLPFSDDADAVIVWHQLDLTAAMIRRMDRTQVIVRNGVGYENVDVHTAAAKGIPVCNVPDYGTEEVADHAITLALCLARQIRLLTEDVAAGHWRYQAAADCRRLRGRIFGVVGIGRIGTATALRAKSHGLDVVFYDPYVPNGYEKALGVRRVDTLEQLLSKSDFVSLHTPLTPETLHSLDRPQFAAMKPGAFLINTARGKIVNIEALEEALASGRLGGAALDVLENEPAGLEIAKRYQNCIVTPHSAFYSQESMVEMRTTAARIVRDALLNGKLDNLVNNVTARVSEVQLS